MKSLSKRLLCLCLSLALLLVLFPASRATAAENDTISDPLKYLHYTIADGAVTITGCDKTITGSLEIPDTIEGLPVTTIGVGAFRFTSLTELIIPASVVTIKDGSFNTASLTAVSFLGDPPSCQGYLFGEGAWCQFSGTVYYPIHNSKWTIDVLLNLTSMGYDQVKPPIPYVGIHSWDNGTSVLDATCTAQGSTVYSCTGCNMSKTETTPALGHNWADDTFISQPTCTQDGICRYTCTVCDHTKEEPVNATGHTWGNATVVTAPSCEEGTLGYICTQCGTVGNYEPIPALGHSYVTTLEDATCTQPGTLTYTCTKCGDVSITETSPATGHQFQEGVWITQPSCLEGGQKSYTCCTCGFVKYVDVAATGHNEATTPAVPATCTATGLTEGKHCGTCNEILTPQETITAIGHSYQTAVTKPTCTEDGSTTATCSICGDVINSIISATGHSYETIVTTPTCTENGFTSTTCTNCSEAFIGVIPATGHQFEDGTCTHCGESDGNTLPGDASGDGKVNMADVAKVFAHVRNNNELTDETALLCADVTGDGKINMADVARIFAHVRGTNPLF